MAAPKHILILCHYAPPIRPSIRHHLEALRYSPHGHRLVYVNFANGAPPLLRRGRIDAIVLHTTLLALRGAGWWPDMLSPLAWIADHPAIKIALPQDEYDHAELLDDWLREWRVPVVFSNFGERDRRLLYPTLHNRARFEHAFTGYIDSATADALRGRLPPLAERELDIVYRASRLPFWFGRHGQLKHRIAEVVREPAELRGLRCDISTQPADTITSDAWFRFLMRGKVILGTESGASALDRRGEIRRAIQALLAQSPHLSFDEVSRQLADGWDNHRFFALGPRHFEAVFTKTVQVLVEGAYDGVLLPNRHYIPLKTDFSNLDEVLDRVADTRDLQRIADCAYEEIYLSGRYSYAELCRQIDAILPVDNIQQPPGAWLPLSVASSLHPYGLARRLGRPVVGGLMRRLRGA
jgi:hypothetical protein